MKVAIIEWKCQECGKCPGTLHRIYDKPIKYLCTECATKGVLHKRRLIRY